MVVGAASVAGFLFWLLLPKPKEDNQSVQQPQKTYKDRAKDEVERVRLEGEVARARVRAKALAQKVQLDEIEVVGTKDPVEARRQLASWLQNNL